MDKIIQHGDVLLKTVKDIPKNVKCIKSKNRVVIMDGEVTGHAHAIYTPEKVDYLENNGLFYLRVNEPVELKHEEHKTITINPGYYKIDRVKEYNPFEQEIREVQD